MNIKQQLITKRKFNHLKVAHNQPVEDDCKKLALRWCVRLSASSPMNNLIRQACKAHVVRPTLTESMLDALTAIQPPHCALS